MRRRTPGAVRSERAESRQRVACRRPRPIPRGTSGNRHGHRGSTPARAATLGSARMPVPLTVAASGGEHGNLGSHASGERSSSALSRKSFGTVGEVAAPGRESACPRSRRRATGRTERGSAVEARARTGRAMWNEVREMVQAPRGGSASAERPKGERVRRALRARPRAGIPRQAAQVGEESGLGPAADDRTIGEARGDMRCTRGDTEGRHGAGATRWRRSLRARSVFGQP